MPGLFLYLSLFNTVPLDSLKYNSQRINRCNRVLGLVTKRASSNRPGYKTVQTRTKKKIRKGPRGNVITVRVTDSHLNSTFSKSKNAPILDFPRVWLRVLSRFSCSGLASSSLACVTFVFFFWQGRLVHISKHVQYISRHISWHANRFEQ